MQNEKETENRQREQTTMETRGRGKWETRAVWDMVRHYNNMTQAEPNDALYRLQALTAQIPDRGWRIAARKKSGGADGEIEKNSDTPTPNNTMTGG